MMLSDCLSEYVWQRFIQFCFQLLNLFNWSCCHNWWCNLMQHHGKAHTKTFLVATLETTILASISIQKFDADVLESLNIFFATVLDVLYLKTGYEINKKYGNVFFIKAIKKTFYLYTRVLMELHFKCSFSFCSWRSVLFQHITCL